MELDKVYYISKLSLSSNVIIFNSISSPACGWNLKHPRVSRAVFIQAGSLLGLEQQ